MSEQADSKTRQEVRDIVFSFFADECDVDRSQLSDSTRIIEDLQGDSLMLLSLLERVRKQHGLSIELKTLGRHLMRKPVTTLGQVADLTVAIVKYGDNIIHVDL